MTEVQPKIWSKTYKNNLRFSTCDCHIFSLACLPKSFSISPLLQLKFQSAMKLVGGEFVDCVQGLKNSWLPARTVVRKALDSRFEVRLSVQPLLSTYYTVCYFHSLLSTIHI